ncbi:MAG: ATP-binding protein [Minicystis sp.]
MAVILFVGTDDETARKLGGALGADVETAPPTAESLARIMDTAPSLAAVVLGPGVNGPIQVAQRICAADPDLGVIVLCGSELRCGDVGQAIRQAPLVGDDVRSVPDEPREDLAGALADAVARTKARRASRHADGARPSERRPGAVRGCADEGYVGQILDNAPLGIVALDGERRVVSWNLAAEHLFGRTEREMLGSTLDPLFIADEEAHWASFGRATPAPRVPLRDTFCMHGAVGRVDVEITMAGTSGRAGAGTLVLLEDVSAREQARREREAALAHVRFLAEASRVLGSSLDLPVTFEIVARLAVPRLGEWCMVDLVETGGWMQRVAVAHADPSKGGLASRFQRRYPPLPRGSELGVAAVLASGEPVVVREITDDLMVRIARDEEHLALTRELSPRTFLSAPMVARGRLVGALTFLFTTSRRTYGEVEVSLARELAERAAVAVENARLYTAAQEAREKAEEASRVKDEFLAVVSHELRTPLTAILGWARTLQSRPRPPEQIARGLASIERNAAAQARIVEDILDMSRIVTGKLRLDLRRVDLVTVARLAIESVAATARAKGVAVELAADAPVFVLGDADRLQQVLWNLLGNALKFTPPGGRVDVLVRSEGTAAEAVVCDTGSGISREFLPFVFDRFRQADASATRAHGGLGLGLSIVRHLVELHGGAVRAESGGATQGATFTITLPRLTDELTGEAPDSCDDPSSQLRLDGTRVLLVDDDDDTREVLVTALRERGAEVSSAGSAEEAMVAIVQAVPDVLVSDLAMPGEDGITLLQRVRALPAPAAQVPALALSAYTGPPDRSRALDAGFHAHLGKPVEMSVLAAAIAKLAANGARAG